MKVGDRVLVEGELCRIVYVGLIRVDVQEQRTGIVILAAQRRIEKIPRLDTARRWN